MRAGEVTSNSSAALARKDSESGVVEEWREDKALGASLDRAARQARANCLFKRMRVIRP